MYFAWFFFHALDQSRSRCEPSGQSAERAADAVALVARLMTSVPTLFSFSLLGLGYFLKVTKITHTGTFAWLLRPECNPNHTGMIPVAQNTVV